jgi:hypothetical protein
MVTTVLNIALWVFSITGYIIYNLYNKNVKLEEMIQRQDQVLREASLTINESDRVLKELDKLGAFQSDDEIGFFFQAVKEIQNTLNQYVTNK